MRNVWVTAGIALLLGVSWFFICDSALLSTLPDFGFSRGAAAVTPSALSSQMPYVGPALSKEYKNDTYRFSVAIPEDFHAQMLPPDEGGGSAIVLQNSAGEGIQIYVTSNQGDTRVLTAADVRVAIPDMKITEEEVLEIGDEYRGVAFKGDNEAFGGASREVWFIFRGTLYQISTYAHLDPLLKALFATWKFY